MQLTDPATLHAAFVTAIEAIDTTTLDRPQVGFRHTGKGERPTALRNFKLEESGIEEVPKGLHSQGEQFTYKLFVVVGYRGFDEDEDRYIAQDYVMVRNALRNLVGPEPGLLGIEAEGYAADPSAESGIIVRMTFKTDYIHNTGVLGA